MVQFGLILAYLPCSTIHLLPLMHSFLSIFVLFVGRRAGIISMWLIHDDFRFLALKRAKDHANGDKETAKVTLRVHREVVHSLDDLPRDFHLNSELQQLSPPSLKAANTFYRISSFTAV